MADSLLRLLLNNVNLRLEKLMKLHHREISMYSLVSNSFKIDCLSFIMTFN